MWFAPVPDTVWILAIFSLIVSEMSTPNIRDCACLMNVGEPAMSRYSWVGFFAR